MRAIKGMSEAEVLAVIEKIVSILSHSFPFGYFDLDDIKQEARIEAMHGIDTTYDETRPLENFLYSHVKNRLLNFKRDNFERCDPPCKSCHNEIDGATGHEDKKYCKAYAAWRNRNLRKKNVIVPLDITNIADEKESNTRFYSNIPEQIERQELLEKIDEFLPIELRATYLQMQNGVKVSKAKRLEVERAVLEILKDEIEDGE